MAVKLKIIVKDGEWKLEHKCFEYDQFELDASHPLVRARVQECIDAFPGDKDDIDVDVKADIVESSCAPKPTKKAKKKRWQINPGDMQVEAA